MGKKKSHGHSPADRRGNGDRRTQSRREHGRLVVVAEKAGDRRGKPRRKDERTSR
jgi:hypothetical protein